MYPKLEKAYPDEFSKIYKLYLEIFGDRIEKEKVKNIFSNPWKAPEEYIGYMITNDEQIVGFMGYLFYRRKYDSKEYKFCNIHGWMVRKEFRKGYKMKVLEPVLDLKKGGYTIIGLNPTKPAYQNEKKLGFEDLDIKNYTIFCNPLVFKNKKCKVLFDTTDLKSVLPENERLIFESHKQFTRYSHIVLIINDELIYLIGQVKKYKRYFKMISIEYISNIDLFNKSFELIKSQLARNLGYTFIKVDSRFMYVKLPAYSIINNYKIPCIFMSDTFDRTKVDFLFPEKYLLYYLHVYSL